MSIMIHRIPVGMIPLESGQRCSHEPVPRVGSAISGIKAGRVTGLCYKLVVHPPSRRVGNRTTPWSLRHCRRVPRLRAFQATTSKSAKTQISSSEKPNRETDADYGDVKVVGDEI